MAVTWEDVKKKMKELNITGGYDWDGVAPEQHMAMLQEIERRQKPRTENDENVENGEHSAKVIIADIIAVTCFMLGLILLILGASTLDPESKVKEMGKLVGLLATLGGLFFFPFSFWLMSRRPKTTKGQ